MGDDEPNKGLAGRRAKAIFGLLTHDVNVWEELFGQPHPYDDWPNKSLQMMLDEVTGIPGQSVAEHKANPGKRKQLFADYMKKITPPELSPIDKKTGFLARGADAGGKGDMQGCGEFNPQMVFSQEEDQKFKAATDKSERNKENTVNRRVMVLIFRKGSKVEVGKWPCPRVAEGTAGCRLRFFPDHDRRRNTHLPAERRLHEKKAETFACRFYERITDRSPCERILPVKAILRLSSTRIEEAKKVTHGAPVALNDDHDNGTFHSATPPAGRRELEPVFDLDFLDDTPNEDDLLEITLSLGAAGRPGDVELKAQEADAAARIRLWPKPTKGKQADIITLPAKIPADTLPKKFFVEGLQTGRVTLEATFDDAGTALSDTLVINVVELQESQGGVRKIFYDFNTDIRFQVVGAPANYTFEWDFDGDGTFGSAVFETGKTTGDVRCKYGPVEDASTVKLDQTVANKRKVFDVAVRMNGNFVVHVKGTTFEGAATRRGMRVGLGSNQGTPLPAQSTAGIHTVFTFSEVSPVRFDSPPFVAGLTGANRISFDAADTNFASTFFDRVGANRRVSHVTVGPGLFTQAFTREDLVATVNHEIAHLFQHAQVRDNAPANNVWRLLDNFFGGSNGYRDFREAEGHVTEFRDPNVSWRYHMPSASGGTGNIAIFPTRYTAAVGVLGGIPAGQTNASAKRLLQDMYRTLPFFEMKRPGYDAFVRPPP